MATEVGPTHNSAQRNSANVLSATSAAIRGGGGEILLDKQVSDLPEKRALIRSSFDPEKTPTLEEETASRGE